MPYISTETINEIRNKTDIVEVISRYVPLTKRGNNYFGICPFHDDHNPSMSVSPDKQMFKCFVCEKGGNVFNFVSSYEHISFNEAVAILGNKLGYNINTNFAFEANNKNKEEYEIYEIATKFYQNNLYSSLGKNAMEYLQKRKLTKETIKKFEIGLSISRQPLTNFLLRKNYSINKLVDLGLSNTLENDIFVDRIMVPLQDQNGKVIGFSGRVYQTTDDRKYINSKESELFKKNLLLYNYHRAHEKLNKEDSIIIMEGFFDVIRADTVGVTNCVATMGTALTKQHISILKKITNNIILCFDGDEAGEKATIRAIPILEESGIVPKIIRLEEKDPDEYIIKRGAEAFKNKVENPISVLEFKMKILKSNKDMQNIEDITAYLEETLKEISKINNEIEIELNLKKLSQEYNVEYLTLKNKVTSLRKKLVQPPQKANQIKVVKKESKYIQAINNLIFYMLKDSKVIKEAEKKVVYIENQEKKLLFNEIIYYYHKYESFNIADFFTHLSSNELLLGQCEKITSMNLKENYSIEEIEDYIKVINEEVKQTKIKKLENDLKNETDPLVQLKILNEIANIKGVNNYDRSN